VDVLRAQAILVAVLDEAAARIDHEHTVAGGGVLLVDHHDAGGDAGAVEQVGRQPDDSADQPALHQVGTDRGLRVAAEEHAVRQDHRAVAGALQRGDDVEQKGEIAVLGGRHAVGESD
jgi:hypothetical protein